MYTTQIQRILDHLQTYPEITSMEAFQLYGITRLSACIFDLKKKGYKIATRRVKLKNRYGEPVTFVAYSLVRSTPSIA